MESFMTFFAEMAAWQKLAWIIICLGLSWVLEGGVPLVQLAYRKWRHAGVNFVFLATSLVLNVLVGLATVGVFLWIDRDGVGLLEWVNWPVWVELLVAVLLLDLMAQYVAHVLLHKVSWMWRFHMVHHSDSKVDATTGTRHHPGDYLIREVFAIATVVIAGIPLAFYIFYRICTILFTYLTHANIRMPSGLDRVLSWVFITPNMHKFHHHFERPWTDTNYGNIFSFWDRLFGTMVYDDPRKVRYGLDVLDARKDEDILYQFGVPFDHRIPTDRTRVRESSN